MNTLISYYEAAVYRAEIEENSRQREIVQQMQALTSTVEKYRSSWYGLWLKPRIKGLYLYGPVGVGKTYLLDLFYQHLALPRKARVHFHYFMQQIDAQLRQVQGQKNPLHQIAKRLVKSTQVLCFDEFFVHDLAYAMILSELLQELIACGVILVISSNVHPEELYGQGIHRERFLPAIAAIKEHCDLLYLNGQRDYRLGRLPLLDAYFYPLNEHTAEAMEKQFALLAGDYQEHGFIRIQNRDIPYLKSAAKAISFDFKVLCQVPRSQLDYLEMAGKFEHIFVHDVPVLTANHSLETLMFIHFIDVMYDAGINIIISAEVPAEELYVGSTMQEHFKRTLSRLMEMQSVDYLSRHPQYLGSMI